jgi:hypothetical protein
MRATAYVISPFQHPRTQGEEAAGDVDGAPKTKKARGGGAKKAAGAKAKSKKAEAAAEVPAAETVDV